MKPESGLLSLRKKLDLYINLRPVFIFQSLVDSSSLKPDIISNIDLMIVRELVSDIYFGEPRGFDQDNDSAFNTMRYSASEVKRIAKFAFDLSMKRSKKITSVDKANVLETSQLWRRCVDEISEQYPETNIEHMYVDNAAMQLIKDPKNFDVILTGNIFFTNYFLIDKFNNIPQTIISLVSLSIISFLLGIGISVYSSSIALIDESGKIVFCCFLAVFARLSVIIHDLLYTIYKAHITYSMLLLGTNHLVEEPQALPLFLRIEHKFFALKLALAYG